MSAENVASIVIVLWPLYIVLRFIALEILTVVLRQVTPARNWFRRQNEKGRLVPDIRSSPLFAEGMRCVGDVLLWVVGTGWLRAPTFVFIAGITIFLANLPVDQAAEARMQYESAYTSVRDFKVDRTALATACLIENGLAVVKSRTGVAIAGATKIYPIDSGIDVRLSQYSKNNERAFFLLGALLNGRMLTDSAGKAPQNPALQRYWSEVTRDGRFINRGYVFLPRSPASEAAATDLIAICDFDSATRSVNLHPIRNPADYEGLLARSRVRILAFLEDTEVRDAYDAFQVDIFVVALMNSFFIAIGSGVVLWFSFKSAIAICRSPCKRIWPSVNYCLVVGLSAGAAFATIILLVPTRSVAASFASVVMPLTLFAAPTPSIETEYRQHFNVVVEHGLKMIEPTCAELGSDSPVFGWCEFIGIMAEPWDSEKRSFDFSRVLPPSDSVDDEALQWALSGATRSLMTLIVSSAAEKFERRNDNEVALWKGLNFGSLAAFIALPFLVVFASATLLFLLLDLRWAVVKRVARIVS